MRIAAFNVENLFNRPKIFDDKFKSQASKVLAGAAELAALFEKPIYSDADKARMLELMAELDLIKDDESEFLWLRRIRGRLILRPKNGPPEIIATGRADWVGWLDHKTLTVNETAIHNTARVIRDVAADVLAVVEAENRISLEMFAKSALQGVNAETGVNVQYDQVMLIDGNDARGIDVGVMTRKGCRIKGIVSHIDDMTATGTRIFSRDSPEYTITTATGAEIVVIPNHFVSKFNGDTADRRARRKRQAQRVAEIYQKLIAAGQLNVVVLGDLNDTPDSDPLAPLLQGTNLRDVSQHPSFQTGSHPGKGTYGLGNDSNKIDYLLLSPDLFSKVTASGLFRKGCWPGVSPPRWAVYPTLKNEHQAASDHHLIWADIAV
jgi:endonuclease/exonuclease/phosphatase family metal-dependent hydrolase